MPMPTPITHYADYIDACLMAAYRELTDLYTSTQWVRGVAAAIGVLAAIICVWRIIYG